jgi:IS30 family transposase
MYKQFTESDRAVLAQLLALQLPKKEIASRLNKDRSSVYRELRRMEGKWDILLFLACGA